MIAKQIETVDQELVQVVQAIEQAANWGMAHRDEPDAVERTLADCEELIRHVMDASVLTA